MAKIDLHTHSDFSDGTSSPEEVVHAALKASVKILALTDHDTTDGVTRAQALCKEHKLLFTPGVEISTREHDQLHFTGYNLDLQNAEFQAFLDSNREKRLTRIRKIIANLQKAGVDITEQDVFERASNVVSRAHIADALKAKKIASSRQDAFRRFLVPGKAGYVPAAGVTAIEAIQHIKRAGGIAVVAHPGISVSVWNFPAWKEAGLDGIEVFYPAHSHALKQELLAIVRKYDFLCTAGSDYHGPKGGRITTPGLNLPEPYYDRLYSKLFRA